MSKISPDTRRQTAGGESQGQKFSAGGIGAEPARLDCQTKSGLETGRGLPRTARSAARRRPSGRRPLLDTGTLRVRQALQRQPGGGLVLVPPKSRAGRRTIPLPAQLVEALRAHRAAQATERLVAGSMWTDSGLVFTGPAGKPIDPRADHREWQRLLRKAGLPPARLHDARHIAATILLALGVPARVVMELLGHSQITLTLGTYTHVVPELARDAADRLGDALWS